MAAVRPKTRTYLDYNATAPLRPEAREAALAAMEVTGNPSSIHAEGRARAARSSRRRGPRSRGSRAHPPRCGHLRLRRHGGGELRAQSVLRRRAGRGAARAADRLRRRASLRPVRPSLPGVRGRDRAARAPTGGSISTGSRRPCEGRGASLLALQGANNETGVIQPVAEAAALVHAAGGFVFCDAVQLAGRVDFDIAALGADALALSGAQDRRPEGAGALVAARRGLQPRRAADPRRRPGARRARRDRECRGDRRLRRRRPPASRRDRGERRRGSPSCATARGRGSRRRARRGRVRRGGAATAQHALFRGSRASRPRP